MVVADIVVGWGKSHGGRAAKAAGRPGGVNSRRHIAGSSAWLLGNGLPSVNLRPLAQALWLAGATGLLAVLSGKPVQAQIVANKAMPAHTQPVIVTTANGLPQVNIQTPNGAGVSMNNYSQFDVQKRGAILNNSVTSTQTQLAGWIQGNPLLPANSARVIVNQVQSANPSLLNGYIEVAGQRAQVVIANPAGISCDGCGFIQADRAVLTTGQANLNPATGALDNYVVRSGSVKIANMDGSQTPYVDVLARAVTVSGALRAQQLDIKAGVNTIAADTGVVTIDAAATDTAKREGANTQGNKEDNRPAAIDVAELGGMYAGQITLLATEQGVGVNNAGHIQAAGNLTVSSDGQVHNRGNLVSDAQLQVQSGSLRNDGTLYGRSQTVATTTGHLQNNSQILSGGNIMLDARGAQGRLELASGSQLAAGLQVPGSADGQPMPSDSASGNRLTPGRSIALQATQQAGLSGTIQVNGDLLAQANKLSVADSKIEVEHIRLDARQGDLQANNAQISANTLALNTPQQLSTEHAHIQAKDLQLNAGSIRNRQGQLVHTGANPFVLKTGELDNRGGLIAATSANLQIRTDSLDNTDGAVLQTAPTAESANLDVTSRRLINTRGTISSNSGHVSLALSDNGVLENQAGNIRSGTGMTLRAGGIDNQAGNIRAGERFELQLAQNGQGVDNRRGTLTARALDGLSTSTLDNREGRIEVTGENGLWLATTGLFTNQQGAIVLKGPLTVKAGTVDNRKGLLSSQKDIRVQSDSGLNNEGGQLLSGQTLALDVAGSLNNQNGRLQAKNALQSDSQGLDNRQGKINANAVSVDTVGEVLNNVQGMVRAVQTLHIRSGEVNNDAGLLQAGQALDINTAGHRLINTHSGKDKGVASGGTLQLTVEQLDNQLGFIGAGKAATLIASQLDNRQGRLVGTDSLHVQATDLDNRLGSIGAGKAATLIAGRLDNRQGRLVGTDSLQIQAAALDNREGDVQSVKDMSLKLGSAHLDNRAGLIRAGASLDIHAAAIDNENTFNGDRTAQQQKGIQADTVSLAGRTLSNRNGFIAATQAVNFTLSDSLNNENGFVTSLGTTRISDPSGALVLNNEQGYISAQNRLLVQSGQLTGQGTLAADQLALNLKGDYHNTHTLIGQSQLDLTTTGDLRNDSKLASGGTLTLNARHIQNAQSGQIQGRQARVNATGTLENQGLINGQDMRVAADQIRNIGAGRIYGVRLGLQARDILNAAAQNGLSQAGTIAAHERLDIGAQTLSNQNGALIYSGGDAAFGRSLDTDNHATGTASSIVNNGSIIDIAGSATIDAEQLKNVNADYRTELQQVEVIRKIVEFEPIPEDGPYDPRVHKRYGTDLALVIDDDKSMLYFAGPEGHLWGIFGQPESPKVGKRIKWVSGRRGFPHNYYLDDRWIGLAPSYFVSYPRPVFDPSSGRFLESNIVYDLLYKPDDPIWEKTGIAAPDPNVPAPEIEVCSTGPNRYCWWVVNPAMEAYMKNNPSYDQLNELISRYNRDIQGYHEDMYLQFEFDRTIEETRITHSKPGEISIGKNLALTGGTFTNDKSRVLIGGALTGAVQSINNIDDENAIRRITDVGRHRKHNNRDRYEGWIKYKDPREEHITTGVTVVQMGANNPGRTVNIAPVPDQPSPIAVTGAVPVTPVELDATARQPISEVPLAEPEKTQTGPGTVVRTTIPRLTLPTASLYQIRPQSEGGPLIETDPQFTQYGNWLTSNYMLDKLNLYPQNTLKLLGDGFYERRLVNEQIGQLTGRRFLDGYDNDEQQYRALMNNALTFAKKFNLVPGIALTAQQMAQLTSDIVWLVEQTVTLPDGTKQQVLAPQVYVKVRKGDLRNDGALIAADTIKLDADTVYNSGTVAGRQLVDITADSIKNMAGGRINANKIALTAADDIRVTGGAITAEQALKLQAGRDIEVASTLTHSDSRSGQDRYQYTGIDRLAGLYVTGSQQPGQLQVQAGRNLTLTAAAVANAGKAEGSSTTLQAGNNLALKTLTTSKSDLVVSDARNFVQRATSQEVGTQIASEGDIRMLARNDVSLRAADVTSQQGAVAVQAGRDIRVEAGSSTLSGTLQNYESKSSGLATKTSTIKSDVHRQTLQGSAVSGDTVSMLAGRDLNIVASDVVSDNNTTLVAKNNLRVEAGTESSREHHYRNTTKSGILSGGTLGFTIGSQSSTSRMDAEGTMQSQARSSVGSLKGDTRLLAGEQLTGRGSDVLAQGDVLLKGKAVLIDPGKDQRRSKEVHEFEKSGLTIGLEVPVVQAVQLAIRTAEQNGKSKNARVNAMAAANTGWTSYKAGQEVGKMGDAVAQLQAVDAKGAASISGIKIAITVGSQSSRSSTEVEQTQTSGSQVLAQNTVTVLATGAGADSDITVTGSDIAGKKGTTLIADDAINLTAAAQTYKERSKNSSAGGKIGVSAGYENGSAAIGITVGANVGKGSGKGDETRYEYTHVGDRNSQTVLHSGGATSLKGAQVTGSQVVVKAADLSIESLQDNSTYKGKQVNAQGEVTIGYGASGSGSASKSKISADYASVNALSGIFARDQGYQIDVAGHTDLTGAVITSSAQAEAAGKNRLTTGTLAARDVNNYSRVKASSVGIGGEGGFMPGGSTSFQSNMGFGSVSNNDSSVTRSGINTANITITQPEAQQERTGKSVSDTIVEIKTPLTSDEALGYTGLGNSFDKEAVQKEIDQQREVSQDFSKYSKRAAGELKTRIASNDAQFEAGLITEKERDERNATLRNYAWLLETVSAGLATPSNSLGGSLVAAASPTIAGEIGQQFKQAGKEGTAGHYLAHAGLGAIVAAATGNSIAGNALAAAGAEAAAPVAASWIYGKDVSQLTPDEKEMVSSIAGLAGAGLSGAVGGDSRSLVSGGVVGHTAVENNYLSSAQQAQREKEYSECLTPVCRVSTRVKWTAINLGQDGTFAAGMVAGVPASMYEGMEAFVKMGLSPIETLEAIMSLVMGGDLVGTVADSITQSYIERIERLATEYERAGAAGSFKAGVETGKLFVDAAALATGGAGLARSGVVLVEKIVAKTLAKKAASVVDVGKNIPDIKQVTDIKQTIESKRPSHRESEIAIGKDLGEGWRPQVSFKDGKEVPYGTKGSVRPDWCLGNVCSIEVKNYDLAKNQQSLVNNVAK
ncbi:putative filamentous hemagglutinin / adhesin [Advenella mimigardefordensis DPN7]|uniref:Putative filamentous hemagglutinin / adhesin n=2 Tax=Advenella mimigardefordensis TaxID=302406 RepID=W0PIB7_ADVMD|nr:putative filamentous hemagglutinin / adhesin [Advenella mimigardefordensis DPN7]